MRVLCSGMDGSDVEGEVIGGEFYDPDTGRCDLEETFTVRDDHGKVFQVYGWNGGRNCVGRDTPGGDVVMAKRVQGWMHCPCGREKILGRMVALIVQGRKQVELGGKFYTYDESCFLLTSVELPTINRVLDASADRPYLAMVLHLDLLAAKDLVAQYDLHHRGRVPIPRAIGTGPATKEVMNAFLRLLWLLDAPQDIPFLAGLLQRELLYRLMTTDEGIRLRETVAADTPMNRVALAITWIRANYRKPLCLDKLARTANMGVSTLHHNFRAVTAMSPLQYQKHLRLHEARKLLTLSGHDVARAAEQVGYASVNQFTREYSRLFGHTPKVDIRR